MDKSVGPQESGQQAGLGGGGAERGRAGARGEEGRASHPHPRSLRIAWLLVVQVLPDRQTCR